MKWIFLPVVICACVISLSERPPPACKSKEPLSIRKKATSARSSPFTGRHGDGQLTTTGESNTPGWPADNGYGFRGSSYYLEEHNPLYFGIYTPIAERPFATLNDPQRRRWAGGGW